MCNVYGCTFYTHRRFGGIISMKPQSPPFLRCCKLPWPPTRLSYIATAKFKMKMLPAGFTVALCNTTIQSCDRQNNRSFLLFRIADFVVDTVNVVDVSVSEFLLSLPSEHLAFQALQKLQEKLCHLQYFFCMVFLSSLIRQRTLRMSFFVRFFARICQNSVDAELIYRNHCAKKHLDVSLTIVESGKTSCHILWCLTFFLQKHWMLEKLGNQIL